MSQPQRAADRAEEIRKNQERCDILRQYGLAPAATDLAPLATVLGLNRPRRVASAPMAELQQILSRRAA
jgi:hypothetical protein